MTTDIRPDAIPHSYNAPQEAPPNWREVSEMEFVMNSMRRIYGPARTEYRQFAIEHESFRGKRDQVTGVTLNWYHNGRGDCIYLDYWAKKARFFFFAECEHKMKHTANLGRCYNEYTCSECGYVERIDSGD